MTDKVDKKKFSNQPEYYTKPEKIAAREQVVYAYRSITGLHSIPEEKGYWTLCNKQPDIEGSEINQLVKCGLIKKSQFFGIDYDIHGEGIIESNRQAHPEANWFYGDCLDVIDENYDQFNPGLVFFDYTRTVLTTSCHMYIAKFMNICPKGTVFVANLMISDGHSKRRFDPNILVQELHKYLRHSKEWTIWDKCYIYMASHTLMATYVMYRKDDETTTC
jgi:hypothetical protein